MKQDRIADVAAAAVTFANYILIHQRRQRSQQRHQYYVPYSKFVFNLDSWPDPVVMQRFQLVI
jgi:hypothetical protein